MSFWGDLNLLDPASPVQGEMLYFHDHSMALITGIFLFVAILGVKFTVNKFSSRNILEAQQLETVWTVVPALILIWLALPSLRLLYILDDYENSGLTLKSTAHQWYWSYELPLSESISFDSYMIPESDLNLGDYRLLEVDNRATLPYQVDTTVITTSADVLHSFAVPCMGVKMDAVPGRLNSMSMFIEKPGVFYGQCSEICGANHSFMPIVIEAIKLKDFVKYMETS